MSSRATQYEVITTLISSISWEKGPPRFPSAHRLALRRTGDSCSLPCKWLILEELLGIGKSRFPAPSPREGLPHQPELTCSPGLPQRAVSWLSLSKESAGSVRVGGRWILCSPGGNSFAKGAHAIRRGGVKGSRRILLQGWCLLGGGKL